MEGEIEFSSSSGNQLNHSSNFPTTTANHQFLNQLGLKSIKTHYLGWLNYSLVRNAQRGLCVFSATTGNRGSKSGWLTLQVLSMR